MAHLPCRLYTPHHCRPRHPIDIQHTSPSMHPCIHNGTLVFASLLATRVAAAAVRLCVIAVAQTVRSKLLDGSGRHLDARDDAPHPQPVTPPWARATESHARARATVRTGTRTAVGTPASLSQSSSTPLHCPPPGRPRRVSSPRRQRTSRPTHSRWQRPAPAQRPPSSRKGRRRRPAPPAPPAVP